MLRTLTFSQIKANLLDPYINQSSKRVMKIQAGDPLAPKKHAVKLQHPATQRNNQLYFSDKASVFIGGQEQVRMMIFETAKSQEAKKNVTVQGRLALKRKEKPVSLKLVQLFCNQIKVGTLTFRLQIQQQTQELNSPHSKTRRQGLFDFAKEGGKVILYAAHCRIKQTYFKVRDRKAFLKIKFGTSILVSNISHHQGPDPQWKQQFKLNRCKQETISFQLWLLQGSQDQFVASAQLCLRLIGDQTRFIQLQTSLKDLKGRACGVLILDIRLVSPQQQQQILQDKQREQGKASARAKLQVLQLLQKQPIHYKERRSVQKQSSEENKKYKWKMLSKNHSIALSRQERFHSAIKDNSQIDIQFGSQFDLRDKRKRYKMPSFGKSERTDFSKLSLAPGVGSYNLPSIF